MAPKLNSAGYVGGGLTSAGVSRSRHESLKSLAVRTSIGLACEPVRTSQTRLLGSTSFRLVARRVSLRQPQGFGSPLRLENSPSLVSRAVVDEAGVELVETWAANLCHRQVNFIA